MGVSTQIHGDSYFDNLRKTSHKMKFLVLAALISLAASASVGRNQQWDEFKVKFAKEFRDLKHESERRAVFEANLDTIEAHNVKYEKGLSSYKMGINQFTEMTSFPSPNKCSLTVVLVTATVDGLTVLSIPFS